MLSIWPYVAVFISPFISAFVAWLLMRSNRGQATRTGAETDEKTWRKARLDEEKRIDDKVNPETQARVKWELENAGDLARIVEILKEVGQTQQLLATVAANSQHNTSDIANLNQRLTDLTKHINQFILSHVSKPA